MALRIAKRILWALLTLWGASLVVFFITHALPGDVVAVVAGPHSSPETRERIRHELHLDDPLIKQYLFFLVNVINGDLGRSHVMKEPVIHAILTRFPVTLALVAGSLLIYVVVSIPLGVLTARYRDRPIDRASLLFMVISISIPTFLLGRLLQFEFGYRLGWFPVAGFFTWSALVLPCVTLGITGAGYYSRLVHSNMIEVLGQDYIRAVRARGLPETKVLFKHALRNAFLPVLTILALDTAALLGGVVFTEAIFGLPGLGALSLSAVLTEDVPVIMGTVLFAVLIVVVTNLVVDGIYGLIDPRIQGNR